MYKAGVQQAGGIDTGTGGTASVLGTVQEAGGIGSSRSSGSWVSCLQSPTL